MKIHQLPQGARFEYEGEVYVKTGPLFATGPQGARLIPKYARLTPLDGPAATAPTPAAAAISRHVVHTAFDVFYARCEAVVPASGHAALAAARDEFLKALS